MTSSGKRESVSYQHSMIFDGHEKKKLKSGKLLNPVRDFARKRGGGGVETSMAKDVRRRHFDPLNDGTFSDNLP